MEIINHIQQKPRLALISAASNAVMIPFLFNYKTHNAADHVGDHQFFIRMNGAGRMFVSTEMFHDRRFIDPVSFSIVMSMQSGLIIPSHQRLLHVFR